MSFECVKSEVPSSSNDIIIKSEKKYENEDYNIIENSNNIKLPEFVNVKQEPYLSDFDSETPETNIYNDIKPNINIKSEPGLQSMNVEVKIKQEPLDFETEEEKLEIVKPIIQSVKSKSSNIYISDVSEEVLNLNSTKDGKFMCPMCYKRFASKSNVQRHILLHTREKYECKTCFRQFVNPHHYERHLLTHSTEKRYKCEDCGKLFRTASNLKQHKRTHWVVKPFECEQCERKFDLKANLLKHQSRGNCKKPNEEPIVCTICDKTFKKEFLLKSHLRKHTTERPFICDKCQMAFKYKSTLIRHVQLHNGIKPYSCKICRKTFTHAGLIKPHMRRHTGEKPYKCPVCNKLFAHKHNMQRHTLCHAKKKHLVCDVCNKTFPKESRLKYHMRTHTKAKPFICEVCPKTFSHRQNIIRHYNRKHPNETYDCKDTDASVAKDVWERVKNQDLEIKVDFCEVKIEISDHSEDENLAKIQK